MYISPISHQSFGKRVPKAEFLKSGQKAKLSEKAIKQIDYVKKLITEADKEIIRLESEKANNIATHEYAAIDARIDELKDYGEKLRTNLKKIKWRGDSEIKYTEGIIKEHMQSMKEIDEVFDRLSDSIALGRLMEDNGALEAFFGK